MTVCGECTDMGFIDAKRLLLSEFVQIFAECVNNRYVKPAIT